MVLRWNNLHVLLMKQLREFRITTKPSIFFRRHPTFPKHYTNSNHFQYVAYETGTEYICLVNKVEYNRIASDIYSFVIKYTSFICTRCHSLIAIKMHSEYGVKLMSMLQIQGTNYLCWVYVRFGKLLILFNFVFILHTLLITSTPYKHDSDLIWKMRDRWRPPIP